MKNELACSIVQDLLPNYIEKLTCDDTNIAIDEHLDTCEDCKKAYEQMVADIGTPEKVPVIELKFLRKVKKTKVLAAVLCVVITLVLSYLLYASEYAYTNDKRDLSLAVTEFTPAGDAYVLEIKEMDGVLIASFKDQSKKGVYGFAVFNKGFNQRYRIVRARIESSDYSTVSLIYPIEISDNKYYAVSGYNFSDEIIYYGLDFVYYTSPGFHSKDQVRKSIKFKVKNPQFLELYDAEILESLFKKSMEETSYSNSGLAGTVSLHDADGKEITDNFKKQESVGDRKTSTGKVELFMLYVYIAIVMGLGIIFTRYFLTE